MLSGPKYSTYTTSLMIYDLVWPKALVTKPIKTSTTTKELDTRLSHN